MIRFGLFVGTDKNALAVMLYQRNWCWWISKARR